MNSNLLFDFTVNKENNTVQVTREFAADRSTVWEAWTNPEIMDQWWAPKPYQAKTKSMDFREGGTWLYCMEGPEGTVHWCRADYKEIISEEKFSALDAFCDEHGNINETFPRSFWDNAFSDNGANTTVTIMIRYDQLADLEKIIEMGFKEGFTMAMGNLDELLAAKK